MNMNMNIPTNDIIDMKNLIERLNAWTQKYDEGQPLVSDEEYDKNYFRLEELEKKTGCVLSKSPTAHIPYEVKNELKKVEHNHPMLSLAKTKDIEEVKKFIGDKEPCILMAKMDGLTCSLTYKKGKLVKAETRGNGKIGEDITHNIYNVKEVPLHLASDIDMIVDGEIICTYADFKPFSSQYKNPRNFAAGSIRLLDSKESSSRNLTFVAWDLIKGDIKTNKLSSNLIKLEDNGFFIVPWGMCDRNFLKDQIDFIADNMSNKYPIDGCVIKFNDVDYYESLGATEHHFRGGLAYKFYDEEYETTLKDIEWGLGRTGVLTPIVIFEPIDIDGTEISRASLHNISIMHKLWNKEWHSGLTLYIYKANQIIPQVSKVEEPKEGSCAKRLAIPHVCPICGGKTEVKENEGVKVLYCTNPECEGKFVNRLNHYCSKKGLDIKGLSEATLSKLIDFGWLNSLVDIYKLKEHKKEWINKSGFGVKSVEKILAEIENKKQTTLTDFLSALGIPLINKAMAKKLSATANTWENFRKMIDDNFNFSSIDGFGEVKNNAILDFDYSDADKIAKDLVFSTTATSSLSNNKELEGIVVCITGKLSHFKNRSELTEAIENIGGKVSSSVSSKTSCLIANKTETSAKYKKAEELNIPIVTEDEFIKRYNLI